MTKFREELINSLNIHSMENGSDTPDFILAQFLLGSLEIFDKAVVRREKWYGRIEQPVETSKKDNLKMGTPPIITSQVAQWPPEGMPLDAPCPPKSKE